MRRIVSLVFSATLVAGAWFFFRNYEIEGLDKVSIRRRPATEPSAGLPTVPVERSGGAIRIATFNIPVFGITKPAKPHVMHILADVIRRFDVVAIQEICSENQSLVPTFVDLINADGRHYDYLIGPRQVRTISKKQYAFVFDSATVEVDRAASYSVDDPDNLLHRPPLVGAFRARGPPPDQAFTFTLINVYIDPDEVDKELEALGRVYREVRRDGRGEDDVLLLGDLNTDDLHLGKMGDESGVRRIVSAVPTNTLGTKQYDNIIYHPRSTTEFTGQAGVFDVMREFNLTMDETLEISDHRPVWAAFSMHEQGPDGPWRPSIPAGKR